MMKVLFLTPSLEHPPAGGPFLRTENSIKALSQIADLHIMSLKTKAQIGGEKAELFYKKYCSAFIYIPSLKKFYDSRNFFEKITYKIKKLGYFYSHKKKIQLLKNYEMLSYATFIFNYVKKNNIYIIWGNYACQGETYQIIKKLKKLNPSLKIICDTDGIRSQFYLRRLPFEKNPNHYKELKEKGKKIEQDETEWVNMCEATTGVSQLDIEHYQALAKDPNRIKLFSNAVDLNTYKIKPNPPRNFKTPSLCLSGYFGPKSPMDHGARWTINNVLPLIKKEIPNIHLYIIGKGSDSTLADIKDPNITITGQLDSVLSYLANANVALVPLMFENGTRFKILEAGACLTPIVSTTLGAEGLDVKDKKNILIADTPKAFAQAIITLIKNKDFAQNITKNCKEFVKKNYSIETLKKEGSIILNYVTSQKI